MTYSLAKTEQAAVGSLEAFASEAYRVPMLTEAEEYELATRWQQQQDVDAAKRLVLSHVRFVVRIARGYLGYGLPVGDLIQEGNVGLMKAVKRFDPTIGVRLATFAVHWIKAEMHEYIIRNWRIVRVATTKAQRKLFFNLRSMKKRLGWWGEAEIQGVAEELGVTPADVMEMETRLNAHDAVLEGPSADEDDQGAHVRLLGHSNLQAKEGDPAATIESENWAGWQEQRLSLGMARLSAREQDILKSRHLQENKMTLLELSEKYGISVERVRQVEAQALKRLRDQFEEQ